MREYGVPARIGTDNGAPFAGTGLIPSSVRMPRKLPEYKYPKGVLLRRVNNSGDISWHKTRIFISEVFRFEELAFELVTPDFYKVFFRDMEIGELNAEELRFRAARRVV
jgi:hypothetical protein